MLLPLDAVLARLIGELLGRARTADPVDGAVAVLAAETGAVVFTSGPDDIQHLLDHLGLGGKHAQVTPLRRRAPEKSRTS